MLLLERALAALGARDGVLQALVMGRLASARVVMGDPQGTASLRPCSGRGWPGVWVTAARSAYVLNATPYAVSGPDNVDESLALAEELIRLADEIGDVRLAAGIRVEGCHYLELGDIAGIGSGNGDSGTSRDVAPRLSPLVGDAHAGLARCPRGRFEEAESRSRVMR